MLTGRTVKRAAAGLGDASDRFFALEACFACSAIDLKAVGEIAGFAVGMHKIADRTASRLNGFRQHRFDGFYQQAQAC